MTEKKTSKNIWLHIMGALILVEIIDRILMIQNDTIIGIGVLISLAFTALYGFWLYKKPHGNMLKYAMILFALVNLLSGSYFLLQGYTFQVGKVLASAALCYCAGRLNRIEQNKIIMPIIGLGFLGVSIYAMVLRFANNTATLLSILKVFNFTVNYFTLMIAYFVRYKEHREAGLQDAPKK